MITEEIHNYAERIIRNNISNPNGTYKFEDYLDGLGENPEPINLQLI